ncbi:GBS Bsp-like repeat-containing protein, partial [Erysipelotrichaceae bacterium HCN-30851]
NKGPSIKDMKVVEVYEGKYTVQATVASDYAISKVMAPTWSEANGQDDVYWGEAQIQGNQVTYTVDMKDHNYEKGNYVTQFVVYDPSGKEAIATVIQQMENYPPIISDVKVTNVSAWGYTVTCTVSDGYGIDSVSFPTWTVENGQDDLVWEEGTISGNTVTYRVEAGDHRFGLGEYNTHIYAYDKAGEVSVYYVQPVILYQGSTSSGWKIIDGQKYLFNSEGKPVEGARKFIIDISEHNGKINWNKVAASGVDGVILRVGYGWSENLSDQRDKRFIENAKELERLGIPYGVYLFSYESSEKGAIREAEYTLDLIKGRKISLPVFYDLEYSSYVGSLSKSTYVKMAKAYCKKISSAGYTPGIYANLNYWNTKLNDSSLDKYVKWVAQYNSNNGQAGHCDYTKPYKMWQYTSVGKVNGISGNVDLNAWYE